MSRSVDVQELRTLMRKHFGTPLVLPWTSDLRNEPGQFWSSSRELAAGQVTEWIGETGSGAAELAVSAIRSELSATGRWLVVDPSGEIYPLMLAGMGFDLSRIAFVLTRKPAEILWATEQGLRSRGVDMVFCQLPKVTPLISRRLKLAAEAGGSHCVLQRGAEAVRETSCADIRLRISPMPSPCWNKRHLRVEILKIKNSVPGKIYQLERDDETGAVRVVSELVDSAESGRATGAERPGRHSSLADGEP